MRSAPPPNQAFEVAIMRVFMCTAGMRGLCRWAISLDLGYKHAVCNWLKLFVSYFADTIVQRGGRFGSWKQAWGGNLLRFCLNSLLMVQCLSVEVGLQTCAANPASFRFICALEYEQI